LSGEYPVGGELPPMKQLGADNDLAVGTVHRAVALLKEWGLVEASRGKRARVVSTELRAADSPAAEAVAPTEAPAGEPTIDRQLLELEIRHRGQPFRRLTTRADPRDADVLRRLLAGALRRAGRDESEIADYEMDIRVGDQLITTFVDAGSR
jgi:DNA-binding FadR family transcriptional regulator